MRPLKIQRCNCGSSAVMFQHRDVTWQTCVFWPKLCLIAWLGFAASCGRDVWQTVEIGSATAHPFGDVYVRVR